MLLTGNVAIRRGVRADPLLQHVLVVVQQLIQVQRTDRRSWPRTNTIELRVLELLRCLA